VELHRRQRCDSSPAVVNGVLYVGSTDNKIYALNAKTGVEVWSFTTRSAVPASPTVANGVVYVTTGDGIVFAVSASTGTLLWTVTGVGIVSSSPAVANGLLYVGSAERDFVYAFQDHGWLGLP